ncbi:MAG: hypothetical protein M3065_22390 [Actinomycetota bacterium]|nr:hypothetical protein [Actinomycetota bacterium]
MPSTVWTVTELEPQRSFTWETRSPGVITSGGHAIEPGEPGGSVLQLIFDQTGPGSGPVARPPRPRSR